MCWMKVEHVMNVFEGFEEHEELVECGLNV